MVSVLRDYIDLMMVVKDYHSVSIFSLSRAQIHREIVLIGSLSNHVAFSEPQCQAWAIGI